jgi:O-antigen ligase
VHDHPASCQDQLSVASVLRRPALAPLVGLTVAAAISVWFAQDRFSAARELAWWGATVLAWWSATHLPARFVERALLWLLAALAALGVLESLGTWILDGTVVRAGSLVGNSNLLAVFMLCGIALAAHGRRWGGLALFMIAFSLTGSRAALLGMIAGAAYLIWNRPALPKRALLIVGLALGLLPLAAIQLAAPTHAPLALRVDLWRVALRVFADDPVTGIGIGGYNAGFLQYARMTHAVSHFHAHNVVLQVMAETGLIGLAALIWLLAVMVRGASSGVSPRIAVALLIALLVEGLSDYVYWFYPLALTIMLTGWLLTPAMPESI